MYQISIKSNFSSAHNLREYKGKCENLHGHNWNVEVFIESGFLNKEGMVLDFKDARICLDNVINGLDHKYINEIPPFDKLNPTSENIAKFIFEKLNLELSALNLKVKRVDIWETDNSKAAYYQDI
ncbi:MAG: 6-carboxytetrahydropterin synthase QueD [Candidatus Omnitrophica bacterium]|nr:6-carboxytetrahydropterin synthase QueD [Candidatus Omnitrophota bacterium]